MSDKEWYDDLNTSAITVAGILSVIIFIVVVLGVQAVFYSYNRYEFESKVLRKEPVKSVAILDAQRKELGEYKRIQVQDKTRIAIPIDKAIEIVTQELTNGK
jgi:beta-lactamase regulating signal transducer with metallopeptidase domain